MTILKVRLNLRLEGEDKRNRSQIVVNIYDLEGARDGRKSRQIRNATIPVGNFAENDWDWREFDLPPGRYLVEGFLPSGESVTDEVRLEEQERKVVLEGPPSMRSWPAFLEGLTEPRLRLTDARLRPLHPPAPFEVPPSPPAAETRVELMVLPSQPLGHVDEASFLSWSLLSQLVMSTRENATRLFKSGPAGTSVTLSESKLGGTVYHFAELGAVPPDYNTRSTSRFDYHQVSRRLAAVLLGDFVLEIIALPIPWFQLDNEGEAMVDLFVAGAIPDDPSSREHLGSVIIGDRRMAGFFGYLTAGDLPRAAILAREAKEFLFYKYENPLAAAVGAYVLLSQIREEEEFERQSWHGWVDNLMRRFPWIPDGAIQFGWLKLRQGAEREARKAFLEAFDRGLPFYSLGLRWLLDGFTVVGQSDPHGREDATVMEASKKVRKVALHTDMSQPFSSVRLGVLSGS